MPQTPRVYKTPAIVLRQRRLGDVDKILTLYTANHGKIDAVAKGVRRVTSRLAGQVEPLMHASFMFAHGRNLDVVTQVQTIESFPPLRDDLGRLSHALYAAELLDRATEERAENFALYRLLLDTLRRLAKGDELDLVLRFFEVALLDELGYRPHLDGCVSCGRAVQAEESNAWAPGAGGLLCPDCRKGEEGLRAVSSNALRVMRLLQQGGYGEIERLQISADLGAEIERHLRDAIHHAFERDVRSAKFLEAVRRRLSREPSTASGAGPDRPSRL
jgi:DNA repair protein RecO (recombination protein O)